MERARGVVPGAWGRGNRRVDRASQFFQILNIEYGGLVSGREYTLAYYTTCTDTYVPTPAARVFFFSLCYINIDTYIPTTAVPTQHPPISPLHPRIAQTGIQSNPIRPIQRDRDRDRDRALKHVYKQTNKLPPNPTHAFREINFGGCGWAGPQMRACRSGPHGPTERLTGFTVRRVGI